MAKIIFKNDLPDLALFLSQKFQVIAPQKKDGHPGFESVSLGEYKKGCILALPYGTTILPQKEYLLPPKETLFWFSGQEIKTPPTKPFVLFGVNLEDMEGIRRLDKIFSERVNDEPYQKRNAKRLIVGIDHQSPASDLPYDLYLMWLSKDHLAAFAKTKAGRELLKNPLFKNQPMVPPKISKKRDPLLGHPKLKKAIESSRNHPVWKELAQTCFGCGICSYVCPLCYCFETEDELEHLNKDNGARVRTWDSCLLPHFAETSNHNFRPELSDRLYNWYFHKFVRMEDELGFSGCVGCNRCAIYCPAKINFRLVLDRVLKDYLKKEKRSEKPLLHTKKS